VPPLSPTTILLDLDGTLIDPAHGILCCCRRALEALGCPAPPDEDLRWVIGPPLRESVARLLNGRGDPEEAVRLYRALYGEMGLFDAAVYPGIIDALATLRARGMTLLVCTSKLRPFAERIVEHFGLAPYLAGVYGEEPDGRLADKGDLIAHLLAAESLTPQEACMVGDREHDMRAAARHGIPGIGVLWGYGDATELSGAGAKTLIASPAELPDACGLIHKL
jgi:phosphoglycolate phosphatase